MMAGFITTTKLRFSIFPGQPEAITDKISFRLAGIQLSGE
jgi:hypothetical protein